MVCSHVIWVAIGLAQIGISLLFAFIGIVINLFDGGNDPTEFILASVAKIWMAIDIEIWSYHAFKDNLLILTF